MQDLCKASDNAKNVICFVKSKFTRELALLGLRLGNLQVGIFDVSQKKNVKLELPLCNFVNLLLKQRKFKVLFFKTLLNEE